MDMFQFITNSDGKKEAVIIPIKQFDSLIESQKRLEELEEGDLFSLDENDIKMIEKSDEESEKGFFISSEEVHRKAVELCTK